MTREKERECYGVASTDREGLTLVIRLSGLNKRKQSLHGVSLLEWTYSMLKVFKSL